MRRSAYAANRRQSNHRYVLGASFFVGNKVVTSHGLLKHWTGENLNTAIGFRGQMAECVNGHRFYSFNADLGPCSVCDAAERKTEPQPLLFPRFGFSTAAWDRPQFRGAPTPPIGKPELLTISRLNNERPDFGGLKGVVARYQEDGELLVINSGSGERGFAVCLNCGYSESELTAFKHGPEELPKSYEHHAPLQFATTKNGRTWVNCGASVCADSPSAYFWTCCWRSNSMVAAASGRRDTKDTCLFSSLIRRGFGYSPLAAASVVEEVRWDADESLLLSQCLNGSLADIGS